MIFDIPIVTEEHIPLCLALIAIIAAEIDFRLGLKRHKKKIKNMKADFDG